MNVHFHTIRNAPFLYLISDCNNLRYSADLMTYEIFPFFITCRPVLALIERPIPWTLRAVSPGVKRLGREAEHSPTSSTEVKNGRAIPLLLCTSSWHGT
jgi:hypothetical protein